VESMHNAQQVQSFCIDLTKFSLENDFFSQVASISKPASTKKRSFSSSGDACVDSTESSYAHSQSKKPHTALSTPESNGSSCSSDSIVMSTPESFKTIDALRLQVLEMERKICLLTKRACVPDGEHSTGIRGELFFFPAEMQMLKE
jgi:hypothetical protein